MTSIKKGLIICAGFMLALAAFMAAPGIACEPDAIIDSGSIATENSLDILDFDGNLTAWIEQEVDTATGTSYLLHENHGGYWADAEKAPGSDGVGNPAPDNPGDEDDLACWAATDSNMLEWTGWGFVGGMGGTDDFFEYYYDHTTDYGSLVQYGLQWWFNGNLPTHSGDWSVEDVTGGDFWSASYAWTDYTEQSTGADDVLPDIKTWLENGYAVGLGIYPRVGPGGHAITCWGVNFDTTKNPVTEPEDYYLGVWVTDSDSHKNQVDPDDYLRYYEVDWDPIWNRWFMPNYGSGWNISAVTALHPFPGESRPVADAGGPYIVNEGTVITFNGGGTTDDDSVQYRWDFDCDGDWDTSWASSATANYVWDDDYSGDVYLEVFDGRLRDMDITTVTVNNVAPSITVVGDTIVEDGTATISGTISDPGTQDDFSMVIDWKDGSVDTYTYSAGTTTFSETHQYLDDDPTGTPWDNYNVALTLEDDDGGTTTATTTVTVINVAPVITATGDMIVENGVATVSGTITDPGTVDTFTIIMNWGEGPLMSYSYPAGTTSFSETHQYLDDNPTGTLSDTYIILLTVTDDDTGIGTATTTVIVDNVDPITAIDSMSQPNPEFILPIVHTLDFLGSFTDVGTQDTHSAVWEWGDMTLDVGTIVESGGSGTVTGSHIYAVPGTFTVTLTVTDDDGGYSFDTFDVVVVDAHGALDIMNDYIQSLDDGLFDHNPDRLKNAFSNKIDALHNMVDAGAFQGAITKMQHDLLWKVDGSLGGNPANDWINDPAVQAEIAMKLNDISAYLATFL